MAYTAPSLAEAQAALAARLNDSTFTRWTAAELARYLREALRTWSAWTSHWRDQASFVTTMVQAFYDLPTVLPTLRGQTVTNHDLVTDIQYSLLEPPTPAAWTGTDQFTLEQITAAIQRRRDQFLQETGAVLTHTETLYAAPASGRIALDETVLTVRRAAWRPTATQFLRPLIRTDEWGASHYSPSWPATTGSPSSYSTSVTPPLTMQLMPRPSGEGTLDLVSVSRGTPLVQATAASLGMPDDWTWVVKWGALADLLNGDGLALDPQRAAYCEARWNQGILAAKSASVVLDARIADLTFATDPLSPYYLITLGIGTPGDIAHFILDGLSPAMDLAASPTMRIGSLADADNYSPTWQLLGGVPKTLLLAGQTLMATWPPPGALGGPWTIALDVVRNAPVPVAAGDILQIGADLYDSILDIAQSVALFKEGPSQNETAQALLTRAAVKAGIDLGVQQASQPSRSPLMEQTRIDEDAHARVLVPVEVE